MARKILNFATLGLAGVILGKKKKKEPEAAPAPEPVMPTPDDDRIRQARKRSIVAQFARRGRSSTILTPGSKLGG
jgi:hypothetical protein